MLGLRLAGLVVAGTLLAAGAADAQTFISTTRDYTATWSGSSFTDASVLYAGSYAYDASAFEPTNFTLTLLPNAENLSYNFGGGVTLSSPLVPTPPYVSPQNVVASGDGTAGYWGWSYNSAAGTTTLSTGKLGNLATLNFDIGGFGTGGQTFGYYVFAYLPGNWTTEGTATGDYIFNGVADGFSAPTFTYDSGSNTTTVETFDPTFLADGSGPGLSFTLVGSAVPEPSTWAMMFVGLVGLGFAAARSAKSRGLAA